MRFLVSIVAVALLLASSVAIFNAAAQEPSLRDVLPTTEEIGSDFAVIDDRARTLDEQATGFSDAAEAARLLAEWGWQENAFLVFQSDELTADGAPAATIDISLTRFANVDDAAQAMSYFLEDRAAVLGQREIPLASGSLIGDDARALSGEGDTTIFARSGPLLMRISATAAAGAPPVSPEEIARSIIDQAVALQQPAIPDRAITAYLPESLSLSDSCSRMVDEGELDIPALIERYDGISDAAETLAAMGWQEGANRQFACDSPAPGGVGWVNMSVLRFADAGAAADAVIFFADARAAVTSLEATPAPALGESAAALAGPAVNGTEYTLFLSNGPLLFRVTGVAPQGDPRQDVEAIATALYEQSLATPTDPLPTPTPQTLIQPTPTSAPLVTATTPPTASPAPTIAPLATATPLPPPTFTPVPTTIPVVIPTAAPTAVPTTVPVTIPTAPPPAPTATSGPLPTPTPRVIRPPTPASG
jgi:hypothetical protein